MPTSFQPFAEPYTPNLVPQAALEGEPNVQLLDLERFLAEELERIQSAMLFVPVQAAYGALNVVATAPDELLDDTPSIITGWDSFSPVNPNRITATVTGNSLTPTEGGVYFVQVQITAQIDSGITYVLTVARNAVLADIFGTVDAGNQSLIITIGFYGIVELDAGDIITVVAAASGPGQPPRTFIMESATFSLIRVSELHGRDAGATP